MLLPVLASITALLAFILAIDNKFGWIDNWLGSYKSDTFYYFATWVLISLVGGTAFVGIVILAQWILR